MRARRLGRMFGGEAPPVPPPPGHDQIQQEELSRLFGRMASARLIALPPLFAVALWLSWIEPAPWRRLLLAATLVALLVFFVAEWVLWRRRGFRSGTVPRNVTVAITGLALVAFAAGALASPFLYISVPLALISGVFVPWPLNAVLALAQIGAAWGFAAIGASAALPDFNVSAFGGGPTLPVPAAWLVTHATVLTFVYAFGAGGALVVRPDGAADRGGAARVLARALGARGGADRALGRDRARAQEPAREREGARGAPRPAPPRREGGGAARRAPPRGGPDAVGPRGVPQLLAAARAARARRHRPRGALPGGRGAARGDGARALDRARGARARGARD